MSENESVTIRPVMLVVDDDANDLGSVEQELSKRYGADYCVECLASTDAVKKLQELGERENTRVALVLVDQRVRTRESKMG